MEQKSLLFQHLLSYKLMSKMKIPARKYCFIPTSSDLFNPYINVYADSRFLNCKVSLRTLVHGIIAKVKF